ncbi:MAG: hypothetical protein B7Z55_00635 [Planctomycetales bacterium 12-60-4]|nr:MAG: hypothetical protein B7Z55_00635 [Planctomycetales bacterium 12-60-4]
MSVSQSVVGSRYTRSPSVCHTEELRTRFSPGVVTDMASRKTTREPRSTGWLSAIAALVVGGLLAASTVQTWLSQEQFATAFVSPATYRALLQWLRVTEAEQLGETIAYRVPWITAAGAVWTVMLFAAFIGTPVVAWRCDAGSQQQAISNWLLTLGAGAAAVGLWDWVWLPAVLLGGATGATFMAACVPFWTAACLAGVLTTFLGLSARCQSPDSKTPAPTASSPQLSTLNPQPSTILPIALLVAVYTLIFVTMNWRLWFNLLLPHGDSAMYEEHLWNLLHGKGFRSYLDQGLFLGEHIQVVHLALLPLYVLWPSHLLLEFCESLALACGAFPVAWMTWRHTGSRSAALAAAAAYLLYSPMQFLDIEIDLKTFRPEAFGIPLLLVALDQLDRGRWRSFLLALAACLTVKEDLAIIISPLGVWIAITAWRSVDAIGSPRGRRWLVTGIGLCLFGVFYLWLATRVLMPAFRPGQEIHYTSYFSRLGDSPEAIVRTILTRPGFVAGEILTLSTTLYALALLAPVGGIALLSPGRLAVGLPLFGILCLNELARDPRHHFHAPLVAIVFWATCSGLGNVSSVWTWCCRRWWKTATVCGDGLAIGSRWLWTSSLATGLFFSLSPCGLPFWDPGSNWYWVKLYGPSARGTEFARIAPLIPLTARVASTDFVHPRFTHHERSYDYSDFRRKVSGYERRVPDDTEFIVIDTTHPYSRYHVADDVPEYHETDRWRLLPDETHGAFIVLRRR